MSLPTVILCEPECLTLRIAGLLVLDRLVVAAHRAGAQSITVVSHTPLPRLERTRALGVTVHPAADCPPIAGPTLVLSSRLLVQPRDLKRLMEEHGRLANRDGILLPAGVVTEFPASRRAEPFSELPVLTAQGVAEPVNDAASAARAARALWASLGSSADGLVDKYFNRPVGRLLSKALVHTAVSPNQVSIAATLLGVFSAWLFARGDYWSALWGAVFLQVSAIVDCVDGDLARVLFKESRLGRWLDIAGDQVVHFSVFTCIGVGLYRAHCEAPVLWLAASAAVGVVISFAVVAHGLVQPEGRRNTRLQKLVDATTNRDFSALLIVLVLLGKLVWFLWLTAFGVHLYWLLALGVQLFHPSASASLARFVKNVLKGLVLSLGLGLFGWFACRAGPEEIFTNVSRLGWLIPVVVMPYFLVYVLDTWGWYLAFGSYAAVRPAYRTLFRVRWAGESVNNVIPSAYVGGEALKVYLLHKRGFSGLTACTSVVVSKTCQVLAQAFFIGLGALCAMTHLPARTGARTGMLLITLAAFGGAGLIFILQRRGMFSSLLALLARFSIRIRVFETNLPKLRKLDGQSYAFYHRDRACFFRSTAAFMMGWLADALEIYVVCHLLGLPLAWTEAIAIEAFISVAKGVGIFVPGALGVQESGVVLLFEIFGLPVPVAVTYAILRRGRELCYVLIGGALLFAEEASFKRVLDEAAKESLTG
jgi:putative membrane protein